MAASDDLKKLSERAKAAEDHAAAAKNQARAELEQSVTNVRDSAEAEAKKLQAKTQAAGQRARDDWSDVKNSWNAHLAKARKDMAHKAEFNADTAEDRAAWAEADAELAIDYAYSAIEGAEYAVLDAILARREADEKAVAAARGFVPLNEHDRRPSWSAVATIRRSIGISDAGSVTSGSSWPRHVWLDRPFPTRSPDRGALSSVVCDSDVIPGHAEGPRDRPAVATGLRSIAAFDRRLSHVPISTSGANPAQHDAASASGLISRLAACMTRPPLEGAGNSRIRVQISGQQHSIR